MYDGISQFYDRFMQDTHYDEWCDFCLQRIGKTGIDVGCGSGEFTIRLHENGKSVIGVDPSPQMLVEAQKKALDKNLKIPFVRMSAEKIEYPNKVDFVTAICDVVNYLKTPETFFKKAKSLLKEDGVLIFDVSSEYKLKNVLANNTFTDEDDQVIYLWDNYLGKDYVDMRLYFFRQDADGRYTKFTETQRQYVHSVEKLTKMLNNAGFTDVQVYSERFTKKLKNDEMRIFFVAK